MMFLMVVDFIVNDNYYLVIDWQCMIVMDDHICFQWQWMYLIVRVNDIINEIVDLYIYMY